MLNLSVRCLRTSSSNTLCKSGVHQRFQRQVFRKMTHADLSIVIFCHSPLRLLHILCYSSSSSSLSTSCFSSSLLLIQSHDCLHTGPPEVGELIVVSTPEGQVVNASFVRQHTHKFYQVRKSTATRY